MAGLRREIRWFDNAAERAFKPLRGRPPVDWAFYAASEAADYSIAWHLVNLSMALLWPSRRRHALRLTVALGVESLVVNGGLKRFTRRTRPAMLADRTYPVRRPKTSSFPSGHASSAALAAVLFSDAAPRLRPLWLLLAAIVSASRVHNRMHHASDVAAGTTLGTLFGWTTKRVWPLP